MTDTTDWKPTIEMVSTAEAWLEDTWADVEAALIAVRPLMREEILAEEKPKIEAAERERIAKHCADVWNEPHLGAMIRALKDSKP